MEPMDTDSQGIEAWDQRSSYYRQPSWAQESPQPQTPQSPERTADYSDMDVDPNTPDQGSGQAFPRWSSSLDQVSRAVGAIMSFTSASSSPGGSTQHILQETAAANIAADGSTSCFSFQSQSSISAAGNSAPPTQPHHHKPWEPALTAVQGAVKIKKEITKTGYGLPDDETLFSHFPEYGVAGVAGCDTPVRQNGYSSSGQMCHRRGPPKKKMKISNKEADDVQEDASDLEEHSSSVSESTNCSCTRVVVYIMFCLILTLSTIFAFGWQKKQCLLSKKFNRQSLEIDLESFVFGQQLASRMVSAELEHYFQKLNAADTDSHLSHNKLNGGKETPGDIICKPLVLSLHGGTGVGKNFMSRIISEHFSNSKVSTLVVPHLFPHKAFDDKYTNQVEQWIVGNVTSCVVNVFIVDEMDKAWPGVVSGMQNAVTRLTKPCHLAPPTILILLSNANAIDINRRYLALFANPTTTTTTAEVGRKSASLSQFSDIFMSENEWYSPLKARAEGRPRVIDAFVPFLPLHKSHVTQCIHRDLIAKRSSSRSDTVQSILKELSFTKVGQLEISNTGCKRVSDKVDYIITNLDES